MGRNLEAESYFRRTENSISFYIIMFHEDQSFQVKVCFFFIMNLVNLKKKLNIENIHYLFVVEYIWNFFLFFQLTLMISSAYFYTGYGESVGFMMSPPNLRQSVEVLLLKFISSLACLEFVRRSDMFYIYP